MIRTACVLMLVTAAALLSPVTESAARNRPGQVRGLYVKPKNPAHDPIYRELKELRALERMSQFLAPFRLPRRLTLKIDGCDGVANAYYEDDVVLVCYEYLDFIVKSAPAAATLVPISARNALVGPTIDVFFHEFGHALFDMLKIPVLGREEDAADLFSAYMMLQLRPEVTRNLILGVAYLGAQEAREAQQASPTLHAFADTHGLPAQRYFNVLCMAYGADPKTFAPATTIGHLPSDRAEGCADEYQQFHAAFLKLIAPHIDRRQARKVKAKKWFEFESNERD